MSFLVRKAAAIAESHRIDQPREMLVLAALIFLLGLGVVQDPMYPWVDACLRSAQTQVRRESSQVLYSAGIAYLENVIQTLSRQA